MTQSTIISRPTKLLKIIAMSLAIAAGTLNGIAQISGTVVDTEDNPLEGIAVVMMQSPDSLFISGTMTDINGHFSFAGNSLPEKAILRAEGIGYRKTDTTAVRGTACRLMLENSDLKLGEVTVTPPSLQVSPGKFTFYPGDIASYVDDGYSLLEYAPLLRISDRTDVVSIIGKENTTVFINGKEPIGGDYAAIKLLQAADPSRIKRVEIIVQPGIADSEHESIVNVIMTPLKGNLVTSDVLLHYMNDRLSSRQQVFYYGEYDRWQFSASFHANESREKRNSHSSYTTYGESSSLPYDLARINDATETSDRNWFSADVGSNLDLGHRNSVGMNLRLNMYQTKVSSNVFSLYQPSGSSQETFVQTHKPYKPFGSVTLNYDHDLDSLGSNFRAKAAFYFDEEEESTNYNPDSPLLAYRMPFSKKSIQFNAAWNKVFSNKLSLQLGTKAYHDRQHYKMFESNNPALSPDMPITDNFRYLQSHADIFGSVRYDFSDIFSVQVGATARWYERVIDQYVQDIHRNYSNLYLLPSVSASLNINPNHMLTAAYESNLRQPDYSSVNPIVKWQTPTSYTQGNPDLKAETSHNVSLTYILLQKMVFGGKSSFISNTPRWAALPVGNGITASGPLDIGKASRTDLFASYQNVFLNYRWILTGQVEWSYQHFSEFELSDSYGIGSENSSQWKMTLGNSFYVGKARDWRMNLSLRCESPVEEPFYRRGWLTDINIDIRKSFKWGGAVTLSVVNLLDSRPKSHFECDAYSSWSKNTGSQRVVMLRFDMTFGKKFDTRDMSGTSGMGGE